MRLSAVAFGLAGLRRPRVGAVALNVGFFLVTTNVAFQLCSLNRSKTAGAFRLRLFEFTFSFGLVIHAAHATRWHWIRLRMATARQGSFFLFRNLGDQCSCRAVALQRRIGGEQLRRVGEHAGWRWIRRLCFAVLVMILESHRNDRVGPSKSRRGLRVVPWPPRDNAARFALTKRFRLS